MDEKWEQEKMREIFEDAEKMKNGEVEVEKYSSLKEFMNHIKQHN